MEMQRKDGEVRVWRWTPRYNTDPDGWRTEQREPDIIFAIEEANAFVVAMLTGPIGPVGPAGQTDQPAADPHYNRRA